MKEKEILTAYKDNTIDFVTAMHKLAENGLCPNLLNDDAGRWAVSFSGYQTVNTTKGPTIDIQTSFLVKKKYWKKTPRAALIYALEN